MTKERSKKKNMETEAKEVTADDNHEEDRLKKKTKKEEDDRGRIITC